MLKNQFIQILFSPFNRLLILAITSQIASMITKAIISSVRTKSLSFKNMATYGGMPSSHTVFVTSFMFGVALDKEFGWLHPLFTLSLIISALILTDAIRLRGTVDKLNDILKKVVEQDEKLKKEIKFPKHIAHTGAEVFGGLIFAFIYTLLFYLIFYNQFLKFLEIVPSLG